MEIPKCANHTDGSCPRTDTFVSKETDDAFVIKCRTCSGINIFPKSKDESRGKYEAFLKFRGAREAQEKYEGSRKAFSFASPKGSK